LTSSILERADSVVVVIQQSLSHIRDGKRLLQLIGNELGVPREAINVVVNRYNEKDAISLQDIRESLKHDELTTVPNDFTSVSQSVNTGRPMLECASGSPVTRVIRQIARDLAGVADVSKPNVLQRAVSLLFNRTGGVAA
jgi:pilus assembly protein CpaE